MTMSGGRKSAMSSMFISQKIRGSNISIKLFVVFPSTLIGWNEDICPALNKSVVGVIGLSLALISQNFPLADEWPPALQREE